MTETDRFLDQEPAELEAFLLAHARREVAPAAARERALLGVAQVALGAGALTVASAAALGARPSALKASAWLAGKWLLLGLSGGLVTVTAAQALTHGPPSEPPLARSSVSTAKARSARVARVALREPSDSEAARAAAPASAPTPQATPPANGGTLPPLPLPLPPTPQQPRAAERTNTPESERSLPALRNAASAPELARELLVLERARNAVSAGAAARALSALDEYSAEFPGGTLRAEAAALRVEAVGLGDPERGRALAAAFLRDYPTSPLSTRVRALSEGYRARSNKP